jgi:hypothetical protein
VPTVRDVALPLAGICTSVPPVGEGVCRSCHGSPNPGWPQCYSCAQSQDQVSQPCSLIVPVTLYEIPSQLHHIMRGYKTNPDRDPAPRFRRDVAGMIGYFLHLHRQCIVNAAGGDWDIVTSVPSTSTRTGEHPLVRAIGMVPELDDSYEDLLVKGTKATTHNSASDEGFALRRQLSGERVVIVDDTFTSGARTQSAASAINTHGGTAIAIVPAGRVIAPGYAEHVKAYWDKQRNIPFDFERCCLE